MSFPFQNRRSFNAAQDDALRIIRRHQRFNFPDGIPCASNTVDRYSEEGSPIYDSGCEFSSWSRDDERDSDLLPIDQRLQIYSADELGIK